MVIASILFTTAAACAAVTVAVLLSAPALRIALPAAAAVCGLVVTFAVLDQGTSAPAAAATARVSSHTVTAPSAATPAAASGSVATDSPVTAQDARPASTAPIRPGRYVIRGGDMLGDIAARAGVPAAVLAEVNDLDSGRVVRVGDSIVVPDPARLPKENTGPVLAPVDVVDTPETTTQAELDALVAELGFTGAAWVVNPEPRKHGFAGITKWQPARVYIAPDVHDYQLRDLVIHEYAHVTQGKLYGNYGDIRPAMNDLFGMTGDRGVEYAADCIAKALGAQYLHYYACGNTEHASYGRQMAAGVRP